MPSGQRCHICHLLIEMRYPVTGSRSKNQGYWSHLNDAAGIAADKDHCALL